MSTFIRRRWLLIVYPLSTYFSDPKPRNGLNEVLHTSRLLGLRFVDHRSLDPRHLVCTFLTYSPTAAVYVARLKINSVLPRHLQASAAAFPPVSLPSCVSSDRPLMCASDVLPRSSALTPNKLRLIVTWFARCFVRQASPTKRSVSFKLVIGVFLVSPDRVQNTYDGGLSRLQRERCGEEPGNCARRSPQSTEEVHDAHTDSEPTAFVHNNQEVLTHEQQSTAAARA